MEYLEPALKIIGYIFAFVGIVATILQVSEFVVPDIRDRLIRFLLRAQKVSYRDGWNSDYLNQRISKANKNVTILQTWIPTLNKDIGHWRKISSGVNFRIMLLDEKLISARLKCREHDNSLTQNNLENLSYLKKTNPKLDLEVRFYYAIPFGPVYIIDDEIFWGIYLANECSMQGPMFRSHKDSRVGQLITQSIESLWIKSTSIDSLTLNKSVN